MTNCNCSKYSNVGQVPGKIYNGQVIDQDGKPLFAGFFYLDADSRQIMQDVYTDSEGYFHFTVPDTNHQNIFIQFYATQDYETIVKTFEEVVTNPLVVLKKKTSGPSTGIIGIAALGIALIAVSNKKKNMAGIKEKYYQYRDKVKNANYTPVLIVGGAALAVWYIFKYKPSPEQKKFLSDAKSRIEYLAKELGIVPSLTLAQFATLALQIVRAVDKCGTDEDAIQRVFYSLNNEADFWQLCVSFGIAKYDGCFEGSLPSWSVHYTLPEALASDLSPSQIYALNRVLQDRNINVSF